VRSLAISEGCAAVINETLPAKSIVDNMVEEVVRVLENEYKLVERAPVPKL
jgi:hypothetical protein